jgi:protein-tyrosine phosphatase
MPVTIDRAVEQASLAKLAHSNKTLTLTGVGEQHINTVGSRVAFSLHRGESLWSGSARPSRIPASQGIITGVIDLHCHLLPGIDDGPATIDDSLELAAAFVGAGTDTVAVTPHVNPRFPNSHETIASGIAALSVALTSACIPLQVVAGAEIDLQYGLALDDSSLRSLALGGGPWLLVEAPHQLHPKVETSVLELVVRGHRVLLAHPERSPVFLRDPTSLRRLIDAGVRTQITASSLVGRFGGTVKRYAEDILRAGFVHTVASDAHDITRRPPGLHVDLLRSQSESQEMWLTEEAPRIILAGGEIPAASVALRPSSWRSHLHLGRRGHS